MASEPILDDGPLQVAWLCYDGECRLCRRSIRLLRPWLTLARIGTRTLQEPDIAVRFGLARGEVGAEFKLLRADGRIYGGADAAIEIVKVSGLGLLAAVLRTPRLLRRLRLWYRGSVRRHHCRKTCPRAGHQRPQGPGMTLVDLLWQGLNGRRRRTAR